ncbi:hypothetical protein QTP88_028844 [Uroleucon formosanum]
MKENSYIMSKQNYILKQLEFLRHSTKIYAQKKKENVERYPDKISPVKYHVTKTSPPKCRETIIS